MLVAVAKSKSEISLSWRDRSSGETHFILERSLAKTSGFVQVTRLLKNAVKYTDSGLNSDAIYYYRVRAYRSTRNVYSSYSKVASAKTLAAVAVQPPQQPPVVVAPPQNPPSTAAQRIYGVTITNPWGAQLGKITQSLAALPYKPTARVVFDEYMAASEYKPLVTEIKKVSFVMGELLDSFYMPHYTVQAYKDRTVEYLSSMGSQVDIWEIGNEINGEWLGDTASVVAKMTGAYDIVKAAGKVTALTLYYNNECWAKPENEMFRWTQANVPERMKTGLDYVFISFYEDDCNGIQPDWNIEFEKLAQIFPNSKIGFGENGTIYEAKKTTYINRYYRDMKVSHPQFVWGNFWWYFDWQENKRKGDMTPMTESYFQVLKDAIIQSSQP